jgi:hypothetical protein
MRRFRVNPRQANILLVLGFGALGYALYLRLFVIEDPTVEAACAASFARAVCTVRRLAIDLSQLQLFGGSALLAALVHLWRPRLDLFAASLTAAIFGLVLYNTGAAALAVGMLVMSFARPVPFDSSMPAPRGRRRTTAPASSKRSRGSQ